jgi:hypothetical protein
MTIYMHPMFSNAILGSADQMNRAHSAAPILPAPRQWNPSVALKRPLWRYAAGRLVGIATSVQFKGAPPTESDRYTDCIVQVVTKIK